MKARFLLTLLLSVLPMAAMAGEDVTETILDAPITAVTVYSDRAQITRVASLELKAGEHALLIENLPETAIDASFRSSATGDAGITLLGLSHRSIHHLESPQEKVAELERRIGELNTGEHQRVGDRIEVFRSQKELLKSIADGTRKTMAEQIKCGSMQVAEWEAAYAFVGARLLEVNDSLRLAGIELADVQNRVQKLHRELSDMRAGTKTTSSKTVQIDLRLERTGKAEVILKYVIPGAGWQPLYDARLSDNGDRVELTYFAEVSQTTGEEWSDVDLTLSTAATSEGAGPGSLMPKYLSAWQPHGQIQGRIMDDETGGPIPGVSVMVVGTSYGAMTDRNGGFRIPRLSPGVYAVKMSHLEYSTVAASDVNVFANYPTSLSIMMNRAVTDLDKTILVTAQQGGIDRFETPPKQTVDALLQQVSGVQTTSIGEVFTRGGRGGDVCYIVDGEGTGNPLGGIGDAGAKLRLATANINVGNFTTVFDIARKTSVPSGEKTVRVTVARHTLDSKTELIARPSNREGAYRIVTLTNQDKAPLMPGRVAIFAGPDFLGNAVLTGMIIPSQEFKLPFGLDNNVTVTRETESYKKSRKGDKLRIEQTIKLTLTNHASGPRTVSLEEPFPVSRDDRIKIKPQDITPEPGTVDESGVATWNLTLAPGEEIVVLVPYRVEYPQGLEVIGM